MRAFFGLPALPDIPSVFTIARVARMLGEEIGWRREQ